MSLRVATEEDFEVVKNLVLKFIYSTKYKDLCSEETINSNLIKFLSPSTDRLVLLYGDIGLLMAIKTPFPMGDFSTANEVLWWVNPEERNKHVGEELMNAFEYWAKMVDCKFISMTKFVSNTPLDKKLDKFYTKKGYVMYERTYVKEI